MVSKNILLVICFCFISFLLGVSAGVFIDSKYLHEPTVVTQNQITISKVKKGGNADIKIEQQIPGDTLTRKAKREMKRQRRKGNKDPTK